MNNMITPNNIQLNTNQITGNPDGTAIALNITDGEGYADGKPTGEVICKKVSVVCPDNQYKSVTVKVKDLKIPLTSELLQQSGGQKKVKFKNLTGKFWRNNNGEYILSASADSLEVIANA
ncbi:hypothetical protein [Butyrivibrio hungatei]|uniref:Uncharacterized protein n=1 Tax=Butyrivibrio hungatei TaxID=185008 RepID=A0A1D9NZK1_9FIRM|nr:hypothetical protein [Butyrivibrio hungatei]AOZ95796.1 hypothetical protein bhn_I0762 [Butyrivibrio hungatei]